jgi:hypothetical protein
MAKPLRSPISAETMEPTWERSNEMVDFAGDADTTGQLDEFFCLLIGDTLRTNGLADEFDAAAMSASRVRYEKLQGRVGVVARDVPTRQPSGNTRCDGVREYAFLQPLIECPGTQGVRRTGQYIVAQFHAPNIWDHASSSTADDATAWGQEYRQQQQLMRSGSGGSS